MVTYIILWSFTDQGLKTIKQSTERAEFFRVQAEQHGIEVKETYWTMGAYDGVVILEAPDDEAVARLMLLTSSLGTVRGQTLRAFTQEQMSRILE